MWPALVPPVLAAPSMRALVQGARAALTGAHAGRLARETAVLFPAARTRSYESGRAALSAAIRTAMRATGRRRVVLPAFTSYSVAAAAAQAGAEVALADLDAATLDFDRDALRAAVDASTAAVVLGNLFGYPSRTDDLGFVGAAGALVIDDAAQALGATEGGAAVGSRGALGVLSFGRVKCVTTGQGGALLVHDEALSAEEAETGEPGPGWPVWLMALAVTLSRSRMLFGLMARLPGVAVGESHFEPEFTEGPVPRSADGLSVDLGAAVAWQLAVRTRVAGGWRRRLEEASAPVPPSPAAEARPAYLRVPVFMRDGGTRDRVAQRLAAIGMPFTGSYPLALSDLEPFRPWVPEPRPTPVASRMAATLVALPCHAGVGETHIRSAAGILATT